MDLKDGWIKKLIFHGLEASWFQNHFALTIKGQKRQITSTIGVFMLQFRVVR
jgi:hypothetical protein